MSSCGVHAHIGTSSPEIFLVCCLFVKFQEAELLPFSVERGSIAKYVFAAGKSTVKWCRN